MRAFQPAVAALALAAIVPLAGAADAATPSAGTATSTATLATLTAVGNKVDLVTASAAADNVSGMLAKVTVNPLQLNDADLVPAVSVEPGNSPVSVPSVSTPAGVAPIVSVASPALTLNASSDAAGQASGLTTPNGLGTLSVLGLDLSIDGTLSVGSLVNATKADSSKTLEVADVALPSVSDILAALGLDLAKLPADTLQALISELDLAIDAAQALVNGAVDDAQAALAALEGQMNGLEAARTAAEAAAAAADVAVTAAQAAFADALADAGLVDEAAWNLLPALTQALPLYDAVRAAEDDLAAAVADASTKDGLVTAAQDAIDALQATINAALDALQDAVAALVPIVSSLLDVPLVSLASATVGTVARVDAAKTADVVGSVSGLEVIGNDVLALATGNSTIDVATTATDLLAEVNGEIAGVLGTLSSVLETVPGISFPAPQVALLQKTTATGVDGAFGTANVTVSLLDISIPGITLPAGLGEQLNVVLDTVMQAVPADLADNLSLVAGVLEASAFELQVGTLSEAARFRPAALSPAPTTPPAPVPGPALPATGAPFGLAVLAALGVAGALVLRRTAGRTEG